MNKSNLLFIIVLSFSLSCSTEESEELYNENADILRAQTLVEDYVSGNTSSSSRSSTGEIDDYTIIVLRLDEKKGEIIYDNLSDKVKDFRKVHENTITATVKPGSSVFWYRGDGMRNLSLIQFDPESRELTDHTDAAEEEYVEIDGEISRVNLLWVTTVDEDIESNEILKYDIGYVDSVGDSILLDPRLKVQPDNK